MGASGDDLPTVIGAVVAAIVTVVVNTAAILVVVIQVSFGMASGYAGDAEHASAAAAEEEGASEQAEAIDASTTTDVSVQIVHFGSGWR